MSTREVWTPGNRPSLFSSLSEKVKTVKQADFYDPYFPLRFVEVPKCTSTYSLQNPLSEQYRDISNRGR
jgi:chromatin structure-remodeling complex subunit RSC9